MKFAEFKKIFSPFSFNNILIVCMQFRILLHPRGKTIADKLMYKPNYDSLNKNSIDFKAAYLPRKNLTSDLSFPESNLY